MTMSMHHLVQEYLDERRGLGFALTIPGASSRRSRASPTHRAIAVH